MSKINELKRHLSSTTWTNARSESDCDGNLVYQVTVFEGDSELYNCTLTADEMAEARDLLDEVC